MITHRLFRAGGATVLTPRQAWAEVERVGRILGPVYTKDNRPEIWVEPRHQSGTHPLLSFAVSGRPTDIQIEFNGMDGVQIKDAAAWAIGGPWVRTRSFAPDRFEQTVVDELFLNVKSLRDILIASTGSMYRWSEQPDVGPILYPQRLEFELEEHYFKVEVW